MEDLKKIQEFFSKPVNDPIDSIKMDVPLFLRSLEYAKEDAKDDMDLHDFTEKAIKGTKQKGTLSMADYDNLVKPRIKEIIQQVISEQKKTKRDRCLRIADRKFDKPSAYKSGAVVRCRKGDIWKNLKEDESLNKWFKRSGTPGKEGGWVDCNAPIRKDGKITGYKSCGRKEGEKRSKYPSCRPTPSKCKDKGKGKTWGKTK
jgi:hypothetical protein